MKRLNPQTQKPFKCGETREDGFIFRRYRLKRPLTEDGYFQEHWLSPDTFQAYSKNNFKYDKKKADSNRKYIQEIKTKHGCYCCGFRAYPEALDFDHINPKIKTGAVGQLMLCSKEKIDEEISKCQILCANCHRLKTFNPSKFQQALNNKP